MRVLIAAFVNSDHPGVLRKVHEQTVALRKSIPETAGIAIGDNSQQVKVDDLACTYIHVPGGAYSAVSRAACFHVLWEAANKLNADIIYLRYPMYDSHTLRFVRDVKNVVIEVQTKAESEFPVEVAAIDNRYAREVLPLTKAIVAVTPEIVKYETTRAGTSLPSYVMSNGINAESVEFTPFTGMSDAGLEMVCAAQYAPWHGIDRLLAGIAIASESDRDGVLLHLAGEGDVLNSYRTFVSEFGISNNVRFYGRLGAAELAPLFARSHIAVGSLALHRIGLTQLAVLKNREYCLRGIPFVFAGNDVDFSDTLPFVHTVPANDSPVSLNELRRFAARTQGQSGIRKDARSYGELNLSWNRKMAQLAEFLRTLT